MNNSFNFKKKFGQNFIFDENILNKIVNESNIKPDTLVIEIGIGMGTLTKIIANKAQKVVGYEIDKSLKPFIDNNIKDCNNIEIIYEDFLKRDIIKDIEGNYKYLYVIANLPYYITTPIITKLIDEEIKVDKMVIMVQKEVGSRFRAKPNEKDYNSLTIFLNYYFNIYKLFDVSRNVFKPIPNVDSSLIVLEKKDKYIDLNNKSLFFKLVRDSFRFKRKNLKNNLKEYNLDKIENILKKYNLDLTVRAEALSIDIFADIANNL